MIACTNCATMSIPKGRISLLTGWITFRIEWLRHVWPLACCGCRTVTSAIANLLAQGSGSCVWIGGPGYRVYYAIAGKRAILLCEGGDKRTQSNDIARAILRWNAWQTRSNR